MKYGHKRFSIGIPSLVCGSAQIPDLSKMGKPGISGTEFVKQYIIILWT